MKKILTSLLIIATIAGVFALTHQQASQAEKHSLPVSNQSVAQTQAQPSSSVQQPSTESSQNFKSLAARTLNELPTNSDLHKLTAAEAHHTPALLFNAAGKIASVAEALDARLKQSESSPAEKAKVIQDGLSFYQECTNGSERPDPVRALCYSHYRELRKVSGRPETQEEAQSVPKNIRALVDQLANR